MIKSLYTSATGMRVQQVNVDVIANNLANVNTSGFKRTQADFQDLMYVISRDPGALTANGFSTPSGVQIGSGAELISTTKVFSPGVLEPTTRELDVAIEGDGFFIVEHPNGEDAYTRDGAFRVDATGLMTTAQGFPLKGGVTVPEGYQRITIAADGTVSVTLDDGTISEIGQITLGRFFNPPGLRNGGSNLYFETDSSGAVTEVVAGEDGAGTVRQGVLERSNVDVVRELVSLITAQRAYEINSRAIRTGDEMLSEVANLVR